MQTYDSGAKLPTHRDYLGSLLGLGLDRACIGDLLQDPDDAAVFYAVVLTDKAEFITVNFTSAGHSPVHVETCTELPPRLLTGPERELHEATVSALRADAVLAAMMHTSRTKAAEYIAAGRVEVNHLPLRAAHEAMRPTLSPCGAWDASAWRRSAAKAKKIASSYPFTSIETKSPGLFV